MVFGIRTKMLSDVHVCSLFSGRNGIKAQDFTKAILKCIKTFSTTNPTCLRDIRIVVFDEAMLNTVIQSANSLKDRKSIYFLYVKNFDFFFSVKQAFLSLRMKTQDFLFFY